MLHTYIPPFSQHQAVSAASLPHPPAQVEGAGGGQGVSYHPHPPPAGFGAGCNFRDLTRGKFRGSEPGLPV